MTLPDEPVWVDGDPLRLTQVLCNLLTNAAKFSRARRADRVELRVDGGEAQLTVADEGVGIEPQLLPRIFERFVQGEQALQRAERRPRPRPGDRAEPGRAARRHRSAPRATGRAGAAASS